MANPHDPPCFLGGSRRPSSSSILGNSRRRQGALLITGILCLTATSSSALHPRNAFKGSYDMARLVSACPALSPHIVPAAKSRSGRETIDFSDPVAVRTINRWTLHPEPETHNLKPESRNLARALNPEP